MNLMDELNQRSNIHFIRRRKIYWGHHSMILAMMELIDTAIKHGITYLVLLSAQDLPLKTSEELLDFYKRHQTYSFVSFKSLPRDD
jgi:hypothetical protein